MSILDPLKEAIRETGSVIASAVSLIEDLVQRLRDAIDNDDLDEVAALTDELEASKNALANAVAANTSAELNEPTLPEDGSDDEAADEPTDPDNAG